MKASQITHKSIPLRISIEDYNYIAEQARKMNVSMNTYIKKKVLDNSGGCQTQFDQIMQLVPILQTTIDEVKDTAVRQELRELGGRICQCLK